MALTDAEEIELLNLLEEEDRDHARNSHLEFMNYTWMKGDTDPFIPGFHTKTICARIDKAFQDFREGKSTYLKIVVHHRSGKTDILSRYLPPHFLGEFPDCEVLATTFKSDLTQKFTSFARNIFRSQKYRELYPGLGLSTESNAKAYWEIIDEKTKQPTQGKLYGSGLSSGITGSGGHLVLVDDPISGRRAAESLTVRDGVWDTMTNDLLTRLAPVHIVIILATQWHWDDPHGRIEKEAKVDPNFAKFETMRFPAKAKDYRGEGQYPGKYLFLERFQESWYESQYSFLGRYGAAALLDCSPMLRTGSIFSIDGIVYHKPEDMPGELAIRWARIWDLAHTAKQRSKDDPDYTSGTLLGFQTVPGDPIPHLWIKNVIRVQKGAAERDDVIREVIHADGKFVRQAVENSIESKDAYEYICRAMPEFVIDKVLIMGKGDKLTRATPLEPIFEAKGHVHVQEGEWNDEWLEEIIRFDGLGKSHDDQVDNLTAGYIFLGGGVMITSEKTKAALAARRSR